MLRSGTEAHGRRSVLGLTATFTLSQSRVMISMLAARSTLQAGFQRPTSRSGMVAHGPPLGRESTIPPIHWESLQMISMPAGASEPPGSLPNGMGTVGLTSAPD